MAKFLSASDFFEIYEPLTRLGLVISLFTNGTLITPDVARRLAQAPAKPYRDYPLRGHRSHLRGGHRQAGELAACCAGIEALVSHRVPLGLKTTLTRQNVGELEEMRRMAHDWGVPFSASWLLARRPDRTTSGVDDCRLSASEGVWLESTDRASADEWTEVALRKTAPGSRHNFYCHAGKAAFVINPAGEMNVCSGSQPAGGPAPGDWLCRGLGAGAPIR